MYFKLQLRLTHSFLNAMIDMSYYSLCCITELMRADHFFPGIESSVGFGDALEAINNAFWSDAAPYVKKLICSVCLNDI